MTTVPVHGSATASPTHGDWSAQHRTPTDSPRPTSTESAAGECTSAAARAGQRPPFLSSFGLGERHSRCSTPSARNESNASSNSSFLKPRVKMQRWNEPQPLTFTNPQADAVAAGDDGTAKSFPAGRLSGSRTPLTATSSDVLNRSDSSQPLIPDVPQWSVPSTADVHHGSPDKASALSAGRRTEQVPLPRVISSPQPDVLGESLGCGFSSTQSLCSTSGTSLSRCRRKMQSLACPAFDLTRIERQQDRDPSFLADVCNAADCHPISEINAFICLGTWKDAGDEALLRRHHIKYVLNVAKELHDEHGACRPPTPEGEAGEFVSHSIPMRDCHDEKLTKNFDDAFEFIERARRENARVLVHCRRGISRSAAIVVAYLMASEGLCYEVAYDRVRARRSCVSLNLAFQELLCEYEPDARWRRCEESRGNSAPARRPFLAVCTARTDEESQGSGNDTQPTEADNSSRGSFNDDDVLLDEEAGGGAAPFSPLLSRPSALRFHSNYDEPSAPTSTVRNSHVSSPFGACTDKHQSVPPLSPFA